jgi:hypothetical protein
LVVAGDALCSFNPIYGQAMSVAALEAVALERCLAGGENRLARRHLKASSKIVDIAWNLAVGGDLALPEVPGKRPLATRVSNAWSELVFEAAEHDPFVAEVFGSVTDLLVPPTALLHPRFVWRVIRRHSRPSLVLSKRTPLVQLQQQTRSNPR